MSSKGSKDIASRLRHRIVIEQVTRVSDGTGGVTDNWSTFTTVWASIEPVSANQILFSEQLQQRITHRIFVRYLTGLSSDMRVAFDNRTFRVISFRNIEERKKFLEISALEIEARPVATLASEDGKDITTESGDSLA
jgi:SPP1 family predicted phage head-tail adaptor